MQNPVPGTILTRVTLDELEALAAKRLMDNQRLQHPVLPAATQSPTTKHDSSQHLWSLRYITVESSDLPSVLTLARPSLETSIAGQRSHVPLTAPITTNTTRPQIRLHCREIVGAMIRPETIASKFIQIVHPTFYDTIATLQIEPRWTPELSLLVLSVITQPQNNATPLISFYTSDFMLTIDGSHEVMPQTDMIEAARAGRILAGLWDTHSARKPVIALSKFGGKAWCCLLDPQNRSVVFYDQQLERELEDEQVKDLMEPVVDAYLNATKSTSGESVSEWTFKVSCAVSYKC